MALLQPPGSIRCPEFSVSRNQRPPLSSVTAPCGPYHRCHTFWIAFSHFSLWILDQLLHALKKSSIISLTKLTFATMTPIPHVLIILTFYTYSQLRDVINTLRARIIYFAHHLSLSDRHKAECLAQSRLHHLLKHKWHEWLWVCLHTVFTFLYFWTFGLLPSWHRHKESYGVFPSALGLIIFFKETTRQQKIYIYLKWIHL